MLNALFAISALCVLVFCQEVTVQSCYCRYKPSGALHLLTCYFDNETDSERGLYPVSCQRMGDLVRIGDLVNPGPSDFPDDRPYLGIAIAAHGLSELSMNGLPGRPTKLQLDIPIHGKSLDALAFAGMSGMTDLRARTSSISIDGCSLVGLPNLANVLLNCSSNFEGFLTFGPAFQSVRLFGCQGLPLQVICTQCLQNSDIHVLRIISGPASFDDRVTFRRPRPTDEGSAKPFSNGRCSLAMCSDKHLCQNDPSLRLAHDYERRISGTITPSLTLPALLLPKTETAIDQDVKHQSNETVPVKSAQSRDGGTQTDDTSQWLDQSTETEQTIRRWKRFLVIGVISVISLVIVIISIAVCIRLSCKSGYLSKVRAARVRN